jgi:CBS domain-containing protein
MVILGQRSREMAVSIRVRDVMDKNVKFIESSASVADAVKMMIEAKVWSLVIEKGGLPEGVVTERDIIRRCLSKGLLPEKLPVEKIMSSPLITIGPDTTVREAMSTMVEKDVRRLFVVENGKIVGRVTQTHLFETSLDVLSAISSLSGQL